MKLINIKSVASPVLLSGAFNFIGRSGVGCFYQSFGEFEKVTDVMANWDTGGTISGYLVFMKPMIVSGNVVRIDAQKTIGNSGFVADTGFSGFIAMVSGDLISNTVTIIAQGE